MSEEDIKERNQVREKILIELNERLNGECSNRFGTCPATIASDLLALEDPFEEEEEFWGCKDCCEMFADITDLEELECCPCDASQRSDSNLSQDVVIERIKEIIEQPLKIRSNL